MNGVHAHRNDRSQQWLCSFYLSLPRSSVAMDLLTTARTFMVRLCEGGVLSSVTDNARGQSLEAAVPARIRGLTVGGAQGLRALYTTAVANGPLVLGYTLVGNKHAAYVALSLLRLIDPASVDAMLHAQEGEAWDAALNAIQPRAGFANCARR